MVRSMTAFARQDRNTEAGALTWEVRSVNHRFLEPHLRLPDDMRGLEPAVRQALGRRLGRGKIDLSLRLDGRGAQGAQGANGAQGGGRGELRVNQVLLEQLLKAADQVATRIGEPAAPHLFDLMSWPGVLEEAPKDLEALSSAAMELLEQVLTALIEAREREGERMKTLLLERCDKLLERVAEVRERMPEVLAGIRARIGERLAEVRDQLDETRLEQEMTLIAQRLDVDEEMDRLASHITEIRDSLGSDEPIGRRLDFLMQELNREANTLSSKSTDAAVTRAAVDMKVLIEQMREQVQNIE
ncbi:YicC/YloC family endoribonuclease [Halochromatium salexigens]|uniref:YicC family protein n=1 Tax=Halochromatium salexigens TaxID=49447 RepID=A0AAJ0XFS8_HALSE|nr:YicC/YloC family endoribonuclease [Halochromatium salexigens]MBK5930002.1 YicC family protein [Halochromatium salexigens]